MYLRHTIGTIITIYAVDRITIGVRVVTRYRRRRVVGS